MIINQLFKKIVDKRNEINELFFCSSALPSNMMFNSFNTREKYLSSIENSHTQFRIMWWCSEKFAWNNCYTGVGLTSGRIVRTKLLSTLILFPSLSKVCFLSLSIHNDCIPVIAPFLVHSPYLKHGMVNRRILSILPLLCLFLLSRGKPACSNVIKSCGWLLNFPIWRVRSQIQAVWLRM